MLKRFAATTAREGYFSGTIRAPLWLSLASKQEKHNSLLLLIKKNRKIRMIFLFLCIKHNEFYSLFSIDFRIPFDGYHFFCQFDWQRYSFVRSMQQLKRWTRILVLISLAFEICMSECRYCDFYREIKPKTWFLSRQILLVHLQSTDPT